MKWRRRHIFLCIFYLFFAVRVLHRRNSPHWNRIKDYKRLSKNSSTSSTSAIHKEMHGLRFDFLQAFRSCVSSLPIVTNCNFYCTSHLDFIVEELVWNQWLTLLRDNTHTVDVFFLILKDNWTLHFSIEGQKAILRGLYRKWAALFSKLWWGVYSALWQRRLNMNYGLAVHGHRCCAEKMTLVQIGICIIFQEIIIVI